MRIAQITNTTNFNGIKNVGYARIINKDEQLTRSAMTFELTNDNEGNDLDHYRAFLYRHPNFQNKVAPNNLNIGIAIQNTYDNGMMMISVNGKPVPLDAKYKPFLRYAQSIIERIEKTPEKNFILDEGYHLTTEAQFGLMQEESIDDYIDGSAGELDLLEGTGLIEKFDYYLNSPAEIKKEYDSEEELEQAIIDNELNDIDIKTDKAINDVISVLYSPAYVKYKTIFFNALLKSYLDVFPPQKWLN